MRIPAKALTQHLKQGLTPFYIISGEEPLQRKESLEAIRLQAQSLGFIEREIFEITAHAQFDWENLKLAIQSPSLFSTKRIIECRVLDNKIGKLGVEQWLSVIQSLPADVILFIIFQDKIDSATLKTAGFATLERIGTHVVASHIPHSELKTWINARALQVNLKLSSEGLECIKDLTQGNLLASAQAIEKLKLCYPDSINSESLSLEQIMEIVRVNTHFSLYEFADKVLEGSKTRTLEIFSSLISEGVELILILWVLTKEVRNIIPLAQLSQTGQLSRKAFQDHGIWQHRIELVSAFLKRCSLSTLYSFLIEAKAIDVLIKTYQPEAARRALLSLSLKLAGGSYA